MDLPTKLVGAGFRHSGKLTSLIRGERCKFLHKDKHAVDITSISGGVDVGDDIVDGSHVGLGDAKAGK
jgi:hypothetical protein